MNFKLELKESKNLNESTASDLVSKIKSKFKDAKVKSYVRRHSDIHKSNPNTAIGKSKYVTIEITPGSDNKNSIFQYCNHELKKLIDADPRADYLGETPVREPRRDNTVIISYYDYSDLSDEEVDKFLNESSTLSKLVKSGYTRKEIQKFFKDETGLDMTPENSEEFKKWSAKFLNSIDESKSLKEGNPVSRDLPPVIDQFLQDLAQMQGKFNYNDIMNFKPTESDIKALRKLRAKYNKEAQYDDEESERNLEAIAKNVADIVLSRNESLTEATDSQGYDVFSIGIDIAVPKDKKLDDYGLFASDNGKLWKALSDALKSQGLRMAGDYIEVEDKYDDDYELLNFNESLKESYYNEDILDMAQMSFETGHWLDRNDFESDDEFNEYTELMDMGPEGFLSEFKDELDFDPDFIAEYGLEESKKLSEGLKLTLKEDFNPNFPEWIVNALRNSSRYQQDLKKSLVKKHIDLANATFIEALPPRSNRDPVLKDPNRLAVFHIRDAGGDMYIYTPDGFCNPYVKVDSNSWESKYVDQLSWKWILDHTMDYGYFDMANPDTTAAQLRSDRADAKKGMVTRGKGQYKYVSKFDGTTRWIQAKGEDKSGYKLDPQKYTRMLDDVNLNNYSARLESYYSKIEEVRAGILDALQSADLLNKDYLSRGSFSSGVIGDISTAINYLDRAIYYYKDLCSQIERIIKRTDKYTDDRYTVNDAIKDSFSSNSNNIREYLKDAMDIVKYIKSNPKIPAED